MSTESKKLNEIIQILRDAKLVISGMCVNSDDHILFQLRNKLFNVSEQDVRQYFWSYLLEHMPSKEDESKSIIIGDSYDNNYELTIKKCKLK